MSFTMVGGRSSFQPFSPFPPMPGAGQGRDRLVERRLQRSGVVSRKPLVIKGSGAVPRTSALPLQAINVPERKRSRKSLDGVG
jgi:hypothetical protein